MTKKRQIKRIVVVVVDVVDVFLAFFFITVFIPGTYIFW